MNGIASHRMNAAGMTADYRVNFGIELPRLEVIADEVRNNIASGLDEDAFMSLAQQLWNERVRECRMLATMLYPAHRMLEDVADIWASEIHSAEIAQIAALYLFRRVEHASTLAFRWIADENEMKQLVGFYTAFHLVRSNQISERSRQELVDQSTAASLGDNVQLRNISLKLLNLLGE